MAQNKTYNRRINLYINGKEVKNDVKSIRGEMTKLIAAQSKMTIGSRDYVNAGKDIQRLNGILKQHRAQLYQTQQGWGSLSKAADKFNRYFGMLSAGIASLTGIAFGFRKAADAANLFEERLDNLSALTGLEGDELEWLGDTAKATSVKVTESGVKIKQSASDILDAYTKVGSQRPELLKNKEALAEVTENAIILSEAAKGKLEPAVEALTNTMNQFNLDAADSRRVINALAAGSKEGAADIPYLSQAIEKMGTTFALMGGEVEQGIGLIEAVAPKFKKAEMAGNSLDKILLKLKAKQIGYNDGVFDLNLALLELEKRFKNGESASDLFGVEHAKMAEVMVQSRTEVERYTQAVTDTSIAEEQARKNTNNNAATLAQAKNRVTLLAIELGEKLSPAMTKATLGFGTFLKIAIKAPQIIKENQHLLIALTGAILAYNAKLITAIALQTKEKAIVFANIALQKTQMALRAAQVLGMKAWIAVTGNATMAQKRWLVSMKQMGVVMNANPLGAIIAGFTALYLAIKAYDKYNAGAIRREKEKVIAVDNLAASNDALKKTYDELNGQIKNLNTLSTQEKKDLQDKINKTLELAEAELLLQQAKQKEIMESNTQVTAWSYVKNSVLAAGNSTLAAANMAIEAVEKGMDASDSMNDGIKNLQMQIAGLKRQQGDLADILNAEQLADNIGSETLANLEEKMSKYQVALKHATRGGEDYVRIQKKIAQVQKEMEKYSPDVMSQDDEKALKKMQSDKEKAEKDLANKIKEIRRQLRLSEMSEEAKQVQAIKDKYADLTSIAEQYGIDTAELTDLMNREIEAKQKEHDQKRLQKKAEVEQKIFELSSTMREEAVYDVQKRYQELIALAEQFGLDTTELYTQMMEELAIIKEENFPDEADIFGMTQENWDNLMSNIDQVLLYVDQIGRAWGSVNRILDNKERKELQQYEKNTRKKKDLLNKQLEQGVISQEEYNAKVAQLDSDLDKKKTEMARKQAKREKALAMFEATINTAAAVIKMLADPGGFAGLGLSIAAGITGALQVAAIASTPLPEYKDGGYNGWTKGDGIYSGSSGRPFRAGEGNKTEWIGSNKMVTDPYTGPVIAALEAVQRGKAPASIFGGVTPAFAEMQKVPAYANGGYNGGSSTVNNYYGGNSNMDALLHRMDLLIDENRELRQHLSDPNNRKSYITNYDLGRNEKENSERSSLGSIS